MKVRTVASASAALVLALALSAFGADIVGTVGDPSGTPISGVAVSAGTQDGMQVGSATSDSFGRYTIRGIQPGTYTLSVRGRSAVSYVGQDGLTVDWGVAPNAPAIATARPRTGQSLSSASNPIAGSATSDDSPPGCKGMPGPPCGPKSHKH